MPPCDQSSVTAALTIFNRKKKIKQIENRKIWNRNGMEWMSKYIYINNSLQKKRRLYKTFEAGD